LRQWAYDDIAEPTLLTVCYGHTGSDVKKGVKYSLDECKALLSKDMLAAMEAVDRCHPDLPVPVLAAFGDAVYNMGPTIACNKAQSYAARHLYTGNYAAACNELPKWNKARVAGVLVALPGLTKRRAAEQALCLEGA
jgi:GH24 family phage-related lysozyme (muramidase)